MKIRENEVLEKDKRYPNLNTVLMVEDYLKKHQDRPVKLSELSKNLPRKVMHKTLKVILEYLWRSGKIVYGPKGVQWIYAEPEQLKKLLEGSVGEKLYSTVIG